MYFIAIAVGLIMLLILWSRIELNILTTTEYKITSEKLGDEFSNITFVVLSDLHNHSIGKDNQKLVVKIDSIHPNFILIAGDMVTKNQFCIPGNAYTLLKTLAKKYKIYYAYGNHEQYFEQLMDGMHNWNGKDSEQIKRLNLYSTWVEYLKRLQKLGIVFLDNRGVALTGNDSIFLSGISLDKRFYSRSFNIKGEADSVSSGSEAMKETSVREYLQVNMEERDQDSFHILIAHNPAYFKDYAARGADLTLSGHVHGGLVRLPFLGGVISPQVTLFPKYDAGRFTQDGKDMIISRGLGTHSNMPRIFNPPELVVVHLQKPAKHEK